jgi:NTE family protein
MTAILFQTGMLINNLKNPANLSLCDILIDHVPHLTYSTGDFSKSDQIYEQGKIATYLAMDELVVLKDRLKGYPQRAHKLPQLNRTYTFDSIAYSGVSEGNLELVKSRTNIKPHSPYTVEDVVDGVDNAMGTNMFDQIAIKAFNYEDKLGMQFEGYERTPAVLKGALHYDTEQGVGLLVNITGRNLIGKTSRSLLTLDIAEEPKFRLQHQKYFGKIKNWWWRSEAFGQRLKQNIYVGGEKADNFIYQYFQFENQVNRDINFLSSYIGMGINYEYSNVKPEVDPNVSENLLFLERYQFHHLELNLHYLLNTMNKVFYPSHGTFLEAKLGRALVHHANLEFTQDTIAIIEGETNGFTRLGLDFEKRIPFHSKISGVFEASTGFTFVDELQPGEISFFDVGYGANYFIGGTWERPRKNTYIFRGLKDAELAVSQFMMLNLGIQFNPISKIYLTPHVSMASIGYDNFTEYIKDAFSPGGRWSEEVETSGVISAGVTAAYASFLGPIDLDISWVNDINKIRVFFGFGYQFNRSN